VIGLVLLGACGGSPERAHVAPPMAAPPPAPVAPAWPPPPSPSWRAGVYPGPALGSSPTEAWSKVLAGPIAEPLSTDGDHVYAVADGRVYCFDLTGHEVWSIRAGASGGVAVTAAGPIVGTTTGDLLVLDAKTGATVRTLPGGGPVQGLAVPFGTGLAWVTANGAVGTTLDWSRSLGLPAAGGVSADGDTVYVATLDGGLFATGKDGVAWQVALPAPAVEGPALDATHVYVPIASAGGHPGGVVAFDRAGRQVWRHDTRYQPAGPLAVGTHVLVPDKDGHVYALDPATGNEVWAVEGFGEFGAQPAIVEGQVYLGNGDGSLYRVDGFDGGEVWKVSLGAAVTGDPVMVHGILVVGLANGRLVALSDGA
jgi:outer membrane protein assembly factor BamB